MADNVEGSGPQLSFKVKTSGDGLHSVTISDSATVLDLKTKLSGADYENISVDRMRLIYSGRVMKNEEPLSTYKVKSGNTIHMVKSAASNPTPASTSAASAPAQPAVPTNMSSGTSANNPLDNLTGARYAGFTNLPSADLFGPNGGMGAPPSMEDVANMLSNPQAAQAMNEAMDNPAFLDLMVQNNPMLRNMPNARDVLRNQLPAIRSIMSDPEALRGMLRVRSMLEGGGGDGGFQAPGNVGASDPNAAPPGQQGNASSNQQNPFANLFGGESLTNPFAAQPPPYVRSQPGTGAAAASGAAATPASGVSQQPETGAPAAAPGNPFAALFQALNSQAGAGPGAGPGASAGAGDGTGAGASAGSGQMPPSFIGNDPQAMANMLRGMGLASPPADTRPPEEVYAEQLRQLNEMGFTDFDRNITALRRSGGNVQGALDFLLSG